MRITDKTLGYGVILALLALGITVSFEMWNKHRMQRNTLVALFDELGSLQPQDPVTIRGFLVGRIASISYMQGRAQVIIDLEEPRLFREGTVLRNENFSLMGQRRIEIVQSRKGDLLPPDHVFEGQFEPGIAEAMHLMEQVKQQVLGIGSIIHLLAEGDSNTQSIPAMVEQILVGTEQLVHSLDQTLDRTRPQVHSILRQAQTSTEQAIDLTRQTDQALKQIAESGQIGLDQAQNLIVSVQSSLNALNNFVEEFTKQPVTQQLLFKRELLIQMESLVQSLQAITKIIDKDGLVVLDSAGNRRSLVKLKNINLFGKTAREKAADLP